jgi:hypothetical protein
VKQSHSIQRRTAHTSTTNRQAQEVPWSKHDSSRTRHAKSSKDKDKDKDKGKSKGKGQRLDNFQQRGLGALSKPEAPGEPAKHSQHRGKVCDPLLAICPSPSTTHVAGKRCGIVQRRMVTTT